MLNQYRVDMTNNSGLPDMDISGFLRLLCKLKSGNPISLSDGTVVLNDRCKVVQIIPVQLIPKNVFTPPLPAAPSGGQVQEVDEAGGEKKKYRKRRSGKDAKRYVQPWHYKARERLGIFCRHDIKGFSLEKIPAFSKADLRDLAALGITTLDGITATSVAGLRYKLQKLYGSVSPSLFSRLTGSIKQAFDPLGLKFSMVHPHNENPDGSPRKPAAAK